jgi:hypothetical protein
MSVNRNCIERLGFTVCDSSSGGVRLSELVLIVLLYCRGCVFGLYKVTGRGSQLLVQSLCQGGCYSLTSVAFVPKWLARKETCRRELDIRSR